MSKENSTNTELAQSKTAELLWQIARCITGVLLSVAGFTAAIGAIVAVMTAAYIADGGAPNGCYGFMMTGMALAAAILLIPTIMWAFSASEEIQWGFLSSFFLVALSLIGYALVHGFGGGSSNTWSLDGVVGGAAAATAGLTLFALIVVLHQRVAWKRTEFISPERFSVWERAVPWF